MTRSILANSVAACLCFGLSAPLLAAEPPVSAQAAPPSTGSAPANTNNDNKFRAAAEPFEKLAETSFEATLTAIDQTIGEAETAAQGVRALLPTGAASHLDAQIAAMKSARQKRDHAGLALSSIEAFRVLISAVADNAKVPTEVSLLDYAGFRYGADLKANPVRWGDMAEAVSFARDNWAKLSPRTKSFQGAPAFEKAIADMDKAAAQRNVALATLSAKAELDLVDQLEIFFSAH